MLIHACESINILPNQLHRLYNESDQNVIVIEVDTGQEIDERDMIHLDELATDAGSLPEMYLCLRHTRIICGVERVW